MLNLEKLFENWFDDDQITKSRLTKYARQHLLAVEADNASGNYDDIITATEPLLTTVENCLTDRTTKAGIEKGRVQAKDLFRETLPEKIRKLHAAVAVAYGDPSPDLTMCFPSGRRVFGECRDEDLNNHLEQLKNALTDRSATVGATHVTTVTTLTTQWSALYTDRWAADAATDMSAAGQLAAVAALKVQLYKNVHTVAIYNLGNMEACHRLCPQSELFASTPSGVPGTAEILSAEGGSENIVVTGRATGAEILRWFKRAAGSSDPFMEQGTSAPEEEVIFDLIPPGSYELKVQGENSIGVGEESDIVTVTVT